MSEKTLDFDVLSSAIHHLDICKTRFRDAQAALDIAQRALGRAQANHDKAQDDLASAKDRVAAVIKKGSF